MTKITIIDYKIGNHTSLEKFFHNLRFDALITNDHNKIKNSDIIILPGVGAFPEAMRQIKKAKLDRVIIDGGKNGKPIIGICLGMQLMGTRSYEYGKTNGLELIPGEIIPLHNNIFNIGWNNIVKKRKANEIFFSDQDNFFFNHSFKFKCDPKYIICETNDKYKIPAIIKYKNIIGIQFHPEKSQSSGQRLIINLINEILKDV